MGAKQCILNKLGERMTLTVTDLQTRARERYNAIGDEFFSDQMLRDLIFDGQSILAKEGWVIEKTFETDSVSGTREYAYPATTLGIKEIRYDNEKIFKTKLSDDPKTSTTDPTGKPREYGLWDDTIILYPTPDESSKKIKIKAYTYPADVVSNTTTIEVPEEYKEDLIYFMLHWMASKDQNLQLADRYQLLWDKAVERARAQRRRRKRADKNTRVSDSYFGSDAPPNVETAFAYTRRY